MSLKIFGIKLKSLIIDLFTGLLKLTNLAITAIKLLLLVFQLLLYY